MILGNCNDMLTRVVKMLLPRYREFDGPRHFTEAGEMENNHLFKTNNGTQMGLAICEDCWGDDYTGSVNNKEFKIYEALSSDTRGVTTC